MAWMFRAPDITELYGHLSSFMWVFLLTFVLQLFVVLPCIYCCVVGVDGGKFIRRVLNAMFIPLTTTSSLASVPLTIAYLESSELLDIRLVRLLVPVFACMRKDASGAVRLSAALSVAQAQHAQLTVGQSIFLVLTASLAGIMAYGTSIKQANLISHVVINSLPIMEPKGVPFDLAAILLDPLLSLMNIAGDCVGVVVVQSVMCTDLATEPSGFGGYNAAPPTARPTATVASSEYDASCEPYFRQRGFSSRTSSQQEDVPPLDCQPTSKEQKGIPPPVQPPTSKAQENIPPPVQPPTSKAQENIPPLVQPPTSKAQENIPPLVQSLAPKVQKDVPPPVQPPTPKEQKDVPPPVQPPTPKEQENIPPPPPTSREQDNLRKQSSTSVVKSTCQSHTGHEQQ
ncbi:excitatory amino acid transporter 4-like [Dermacentor silvarum]|uniref:excitatory amino acid transporter 4-like n=1 Tax=Dermacentor silvarum TaxID=543639 RepID=UPI00189749D6|nr:excitatory amino acid transporter 4-like [Dermacentor silvarum]